MNDEGLSESYKKTHLKQLSLLQANLKQEQNERSLQGQDLCSRPSWENQMK